jgi:hypothetical protein
VKQTPLMRPLRWPALWLGLWLLAIGIVVAGSLLPPPPDLPAVRGGDKLAHLAAYALLMAAAVQLFERARILLAIAGLLALLGLGLEFAQGALTATRQFDPWDALANAGGVLLGGLPAFTPAAGWLQRLFPSRS